MPAPRISQIRSGPGGMTAVVVKEPKACPLALAQPPTGHQTSGAPHDCSRCDVAPENEQFRRVHFQAFHFQRSVILGSIRPPPICRSFYHPFLLSPSPLPSASREAQKSMGLCTGLRALKNPAGRRSSRRATLGNQQGKAVVTSHGSKQAQGLRLSAVVS